MDFFDRFRGKTATFSKQGLREIVAGSKVPVMKVMNYPEIVFFDDYSSPKPYFSNMNPLNLSRESSQGYRQSRQSHTRAELGNYSISLPPPAFQQSYDPQIVYPQGNQSVMPQQADTPLALRNRSLISRPNQSRTSTDSASPSTPLGINRPTRHSRQQLNQSYTQENSNKSSIQYGNPRVGYDSIQRTSNHENGFEIKIRPVRESSKKPVPPEPKFSNSDLRQVYYLKPGENPSRVEPDKSETLARLNSQKLRDPKYRARSSASQKEYENEDRNYRPKPRSGPTYYQKRPVVSDSKINKLVEEKVAKYLENLSKVDDTMMWRDFSNNKERSNKLYNPLELERIREANMEEIKKINMEIAKEKGETHIKRRRFGEEPKFKSYAQSTLKVQENVNKMLGVEMDKEDFISDIEWMRKYIKEDEP